MFTKNNIIYIQHNDMFAYFIYIVTCNLRILDYLKVFTIIIYIQLCSVAPSTTQDSLQIDLTNEEVYNYAGLRG